MTKSSRFHSSRMRRIAAYTSFLVSLKLMCCGFVLSACLPTLIFTGETADDHFGDAVADAGDVNNDGYDDLIIGAIWNGEGGYHAGKVYIFSGLTGSLLYSFIGEAADDAFGTSVAGAGDVNNDGFDDVIIGAFTNDAGGYNAGRAYVYSGLTGFLLYTFTGESAGDRFGVRVAGAGDVNSDGYDDLIIGAYYSDVPGDQAGSAYVYSGLNGDLIYAFTGEAAEDRFGKNVAGAGDVNNDGYDDFVIGAHGNDAGGTDAGSAYVYSGLDGTLLYRFNGEVAGELLGAGGKGVAGAGDVNNDGHADLIIAVPFGAAGGLQTGKARVYSGLTGTILYTLTGEAADDRFGWSVACAGDVDADGYDDLIIGAPENDTGGANAGAAYVYSGRTGNLLYSFTGEAPDDRFGDNLAGAGDVNNDGYDDLIIGSWGNDAGGDNAGRVYVFTPFADTDDDGITDCEDNCPFVANPSQADTDMDGEGDVCDTDDDNDTIPDSLDNCSLDHNPAQEDWDRDTVGDSCDTCTDSDGDGYGDPGFPVSTCDIDNCAIVFNPDQADSNGDGQGDACDCACRHQSDFDEDGFVTAIDMASLIDVLFAGGEDPKDPVCPTTRGDFDCDGFSTVLDLSGLIDHLFSGGPGPCEPCALLRGGRE